jgi:hypothetical protein
MFINVHAQWSYLGLGGKPTTALTIYSDTLYASTYDGIYKKNVNSSDTLWSACGMQGNHVVQTLVQNNHTFICVVEIGYTETTQIYKSTDSGSSFILMNSDTSDHNNYQYLSAMTHPEGNFDTLYFLNHRLKTFDGGITWDTINVNVDLNLTSRFIKVNPEDHSQLFIGGETTILSPYIQTSTDYGNQWSMLPNMFSYFPGDNCVHDMVIDGTEWFGAGEGVVGKTSDGGTTWNQILNLWEYPIQWQLYLFDIEFSPTDKNRLYATGLASLENTNKVPLFYSSNHGAAWDTLSYNSNWSPRIVSLAVMNTTKGDKVFLGGNGVYLFENIITSVTDNSPATPKYYLSQNYPNPFNPSTNISFSLPSKTFVSLKILDITGREVAALVNKELPAGNHSKQWNAVHVSSGVYFYRLQTGVYTETKKLILLR